MLHIYTDGSAHATGGPGGFGVVVVSETGILMHAMPLMAESHNHAELAAVVWALNPNYTGPQRPVTVHSDSQYVVQGINTDYAGWVLRGWLNSKNEPIKYQQLWKALRTLKDVRKATFVHVKGHTEDRFNTLADRLAGMATEQAKLGYPL